jgi:hypothetical protein
MRVLLCRIQKHPDTGMLVLSEGEDIYAWIDDCGFFADYINKEVRITIEDADVPEEIGFKVVRKRGENIYRMEDI